MVFLNSRTLLFTLVFIILVAVGRRETSYIDIEETTLQAPDFTLQSLSGQEVSLEKYRGKYVLINFWATWCGPCVSEMPALERLYKRFKERDFEILAVSMDRADKSVVERFAGDNGLTFPILLDRDNAVSSSYRVSSIPVTYVVNPSGFLVSKTVGIREWDSEENFSLIEEMLERGKNGK